MDESIQIHGGLVDFKEGLVVEVFGVGTFRREQHLHGLVEVLDLLAEAVQVEVVANVIFVDLDKELVAFEVAKPANPAESTLGVVVIV